MTDNEHPWKPGGALGWGCGLRQVVTLKEKVILRTKLSQLSHGLQKQKQRGQIWCWGGNSLKYMHCCVWSLTSSTSCYWGPLTCKRMPGELQRAGGRQLKERSAFKNHIFLVWTQRSQRAHPRTAVPGSWSGIRSGALLCPQARSTPAHFHIPFSTERSFTSH